MIHGKNHIGYSLAATGVQTFQSFNPTTGEPLEETFVEVTESELDRALYLAEAAFHAYKKISPLKKADFLDAIADEILALGDVLVQTAMMESGLPEARITGERGRTMNQLKMFADCVRKGDWVEASIDHAIADRAPIPKPDLRMMRIPVGPVVVFTASNFPLAFSTAGGDTASALAAGCPVIVKCHESHPATNGLVSDAIIRAAQKTGMPEGVYSSVQGTGFSLGEKLVKHSAIKSVAFTGSHNGGMALQNYAKDREEPIPVFAEMGSVNPSFLLAGKLNENPESLAENMAASVLMGVGQFCTNPGVLLLPKSDATHSFLERLAADLTAADPATMLNEGIQSNYTQKKEKAFQKEGVVDISHAIEQAAFAAVAVVSGANFIQNPDLQEEVFGPFTLAVICENEEEMELCALSLSGQLTATIWMNEDDQSQASLLLDILEDKAGRVLFNGVPTGVEVCHSMQHGGPYPATTDSRFTSVGTDAIKRFSRPVSYQNTPNALLPDELKEANPLSIVRRVNGTFEL